ncbi:MAG: GHKL domain-containing protein [Candidatus Magnetoovum sp. WYHC-5]|nr:GHKL domain-containing protein [Candidatus Magnetoovum sp. WYHC-5]
MSKIIKIIFLFVIINIIWFSILNIIAINNYSNNIEELYTKQSTLYAKLYMINKEKMLPDFIVISKKPLFDKGLLPINTEHHNVYFYLKDKFINEELYKFAIHLFAIESFFFLSLIFFTYLTISSFISNIKANERFLNLLLISLNHKIGNFLSLQHINLEIIKGSECSKWVSNAIKRLEDAYVRIENDVRRTLHLVKERAAYVYEEIDLPLIATNILGMLHSELYNKQISCNYKAVTILANTTDIEDILYNLIDNAVKYSTSIIKIQIYGDKRYAVVTIENDIAKDAKQGTGIGIDIIRKILKKYKGTLTITVQDSYYAKVKIPIKKI